jgi:hypothetical protein
MIRNARIQIAENDEEIVSFKISFKIMRKTILQ